MGRYKNKRVKAPLGAAIPIITTALSTAGSIFGSILSNNAQKDAIRKQEQLAKYQNKLNEDAGMSQTLNGYLNVQNQTPDFRQYMYKNGGRIPRTGVRVERGGRLFPLGGNLAYVSGRPHSKGGVDLNVDGIPAEVEGGETIARLGNQYEVFSNDKRMRSPLLGNRTPSQYTRTDPGNPQVQMIAKVVQDLTRKYLEFNDDESKRSIKNTPPVGRIKAPFGFSFDPWAFDATRNVLNNFRKYGRTIGGDVNMGINTGSRSYNPNVDRTIGGTVNMGVNTTARQQVADAMSNVHSLYKKVPTYKTSKWNKFNDWLGIRSKPIDYVNLAAGIGGALASSFVRKSGSNSVSDLLANYRKQLEGSRYNRSSYIDADTTATDWAKHAALSRTSQNALRLAGQNTSSASNLLDRSNEILSNALIEHNKIFDENRKENLERRFQNTANRNQFNLQQDANAADYEMKKLSALGELTAQQAGFEDSRINDNRQMWRDITSAITNFGQVGMDRMQDQRLFTNNMLMNLMNIKDDKIFDRIEEYFPGMLDALRRSPYSIANTKGYI